MANHGSLNRIYRITMFKFEEKFIPKIPLKLYLQSSTAETFVRVYPLSNHSSNPDTNAYNLLTITCSAVLPSSFPKIRKLPHQKEETYHPAPREAAECEPEPIEYYLISTVLFLMVHELHLYYLHRCVFVRLTNPLPKLKIDTTCSSLRFRLPRLSSTIKFYE